MYSKIFNPNTQKYVPSLSKKGIKIINNYIQHAGSTSTETKDGNDMSSILSSDKEIRVLRSFEQDYDNTFWVSCHGLYENKQTFIVPLGCKLIFTTWLGKLGEGDNYQENAIFRDLQEKNPIQFIETGSSKNKGHSVLPEILQKDNTWGRSNMSLFNNRVIYNEGDECPDLHMLMDKECWKQGFYLVPILKKLDYYVKDIENEEDEPDCHPLNKQGADYYWEPVLEKIDGEEETEGDNPKWKSHMSKTLKNIAGKTGNIKSIFSRGDSDSTQPDKTDRWGAQRTISNVLDELTSNGIKGVFIITLCRPSDTMGSTYYDIDGENPRTLVSHEALLNKSDLDSIRRIESVQKNLNIEYQGIYNTIKSDQQRDGLNVLKNLPDATFLENLPHYESDISYDKYKKNIVNLLTGKEMVLEVDINENYKIEEEWLDDLLDKKLNHKVPPIQKPMRVVGNITGPTLSGTDRRHGVSLLRTMSKNTAQGMVTNESIELIRRDGYLPTAYNLWIELALEVKTLSENKTKKQIEAIAKSKNIKLSEEKKKEDKNETCH